MKSLEIIIAEWIWACSGLDIDESWQGFYFDDAVKELEQILKGEK